MFKGIYARVKENPEIAIQFVVISLLLYFIFLFHLTSFPIRPWDETMYAVNAYEMIQRHSWFIPYFNGSIDYRDSKPLLAVWAQIAGIKMLGFSELAVRLPSAMAGIFASILVFKFVGRTGNKLWAWCAFLVLVTSSGFVSFHTSRTGDTDALLTLFLLLSNIFFFFYLYRVEDKNKNILLFFLFMGLAFGVKSVTIFLFSPAYLFMLSISKKWGDILRRGSTYIGVLIFLALVCFFIFSRQLNDPTYIRTILVNDASRIMHGVEGHDAPFDTYFNNFYNTRFSIWIAVFIFALVIIIAKRKENPYNHLLFWALSLIVSYLTVISLSITKLEWYDMPLYPYLAIITGFGIYYSFREFKILKKHSPFMPLVMILIFCVPIYYAIKHSRDNEIGPGEKKLERIAEYIYTRNSQGLNLDNYNVINTWYDEQSLFYKYLLQEKNEHIRLIDTIAIKPQTKVICSDTLVKKFIQKKFSNSVIDRFDEVTVYQINSAL